MDHRRLQRTLFRMQHDAAFTARLRAGDAAAAASTGLGAGDLAVLRALDPAALGADRGGRRAAQLLRNLASELPLAVAVGPDGAGGRGWLAGFPASEDFHGAVARDERLPLAFARHAIATARAAHPAFAVLVALEAALVAARRRVPGAPRPALSHGHLRRTPHASLEALPAGTFALARRVREALDAGVPLTDAARMPSGTEREQVLLLPRPPASRFALPEVHVEPLSDLVAAFLEAAGEALSPQDVAAFTRQQGLAAPDVEAVIAEFVAEGILERG